MMTGTQNEKMTRIQYLSKSISRVMLTTILQSLNFVKEKSMLKTKVIFPSKVPSRRSLTRKLSFLGEVQIVIFYDDKLAPSILEEWIDISDLSISLKAGEGLKSFKNVESYLLKIQNTLTGTCRTKIIFMAIGGGSIGDFVGFLASIYKRGVNLVQVPSTWLSAIDSAHGGKTALNMGTLKNQVGSFYPSCIVYISKQILFTQPQNLADDSLGEILKMALINSPSLWKKFQNKTYLNSEELFSLIPLAIESKYKIVYKDPYELKGERKKLNLGHTIGHIIESYYSLSHGTSVLLGMIFSLKWSFEKKLMNEKFYDKILSSLYAPREIPSLIDMILRNPIPYDEFLKRLSQDKKLTSSKKIDFIFIHKIGKVKVTPVTLKNVTKEVLRQKWVKEY